MSWISVKDRLPEERKELLLYVSDCNSLNEGNFKIGYLTKVPRIGWQWQFSGPCCAYSDVYGTITHWMPLPGTPE